MRFFIIHGYNGNPSENWFPWLKSELENDGHEVFVPHFPFPPVLKTWMDVMSNYEIKENDIFIAHSLGPSFVLSVLEKLNDDKNKIKACYFVAGFVGKLGVDFDENMKTITQKEFDWQKIKETCNYFLLFNSNNDPFVPLSKGLELQKLLNSELRIIMNAGHINIKSGYDKFEKLLIELRKLDRF